LLSPARPSRPHLMSYIPLSIIKQQLKYLEAQKTLKLVVVAREMEKLKWKN